MLPRDARLTKKNEFEKVKQNGEILQSPLFGLVFITQRTGPTRFGIVVSTKISKKAIQRNRAKRIMREILRETLARISPGFDVVFLAKKKIIQATKKEMEDQTKTLLEKAGILK